MVPGLENLTLFSLTVGEAILGLLVALLCGAIIALFHRVTYRGISYSGGYFVSLIMLTMITALVIMVIGSNLARAFGLVGAMSIIRFRTAVKDTQDIVFIFFALAAGLAAGSGMYSVGIWGTLFIGAVVYLLSLVDQASPYRPEYLVQLITRNEEQPEPELHAVLTRFCSRFSLVNLKRTEEGGDRLAEYSYYVVLRKPRDAGDFTAELQGLAGVSRVNVFFDKS